MTIYLRWLLSLDLIFKTRTSLNSVLEIGKEKISKWNQDGPKMFPVIKVPYFLIHKSLQSIFILLTALFFTHSSMHWLKAISAVTENFNSYLSENNLSPNNLVKQLSEWYISYKVGWYIAFYSLLLFLFQIVGLALYVLWFQLCITQCVTRGLSI